MKSYLSRNVSCTLSSYTLGCAFVAVLMISLFTSANVWADAVGDWNAWTSGTLDLSSNLTFPVTPGESDPTTAVLTGDAILNGNNNVIGGADTSNKTEVRLIDAGNNSLTVNSVTMQNNLFSYTDDTEVEDKPYVYGGAISSGGKITVTDSNFNNLALKVHGGDVNLDAKPSYDYSLTGQGGVIGTSATSTGIDDITVSITGSTFSNNQIIAENEDKVYGGVISIPKGTLYLGEGNVFSYNSIKAEEVTQGELTDTPGRGYGPAIIAGNIVIDGTNNPGKETYSNVFSHNTNNYCDMFFSGAILAILTDTDEETGESSGGQILIKGGKNSFQYNTGKSESSELDLSLGGAITAFQLTINDGSSNTFSNNSSAFGGAIGLMDTRFELNGGNNSFCSNTAKSMGGAICAMGDMYLQATESGSYISSGSNNFKENKAQRAGGVIGYFNANFTISGGKNTFDSNEILDGGYVEMYPGFMNLADWGGGAAIFSKYHDMWGSISYTGTITIKDGENGTSPENTFINNKVTVKDGKVVGGAIGLEQTQLNISGGTNNLRVIELFFMKMRLLI